MRALPRWTEESSPLSTVRESTRAHPIFLDCTIIGEHVVPNAGGIVVSLHHPRGLRVERPRVRIAIQNFQGDNWHRLDIFQDALRGALPFLEQVLR